MRKIGEFGRGWLYHDVTGLQLAAKAHPSLRWYRRTHTFAFAGLSYIDTRRYWLIGFAHVWIACWWACEHVLRALWYSGVLSTREGYIPSWRDLTWHWQRTWDERLNALYKRAHESHATGWENGYAQRAKDMLAAFNADMKGRRE